VAKRIVDLAKLGVAKTSLRVARKAFRRIALPFIQGMGEAYGTSPADGIAKLVDDGKTLKQLIEENPEEVEVFRRSTWSHIVDLVTRYKRARPWFGERGADILLEEIMRKDTPDMYRVLAERGEKGKRWLADSLEGVGEVLFGRSGGREMA